MYVKNRLLGLIYRGLIGLLAIVATWSLFAMLGESAWRLFITWVVMLASIYYVCSTLFAVCFGRRKSSGWTPAPTWQLAVIVAFALVVAEGIMGEGVAEVHGLIGLLIRVVLPILVVADWLVFSKKGQLRLVDPWYALALPACYAAWILISADLTKQTWAYPYQNFEIAAVGVPTLLWWLVLMVVVILLAGYVIYLLDFVMSGRLSQYIVMPKIKLIEIKDDEEESKPEDKEAVTSVVSAPASTQASTSASVSSSASSSASNSASSSVKNEAPKSVPVKKTMDVTQTKSNKKPAKIIETEKSVKPAETVSVTKKSKPLTAEKQEKLVKQTTAPTETRPTAPDKPEKPQAPQVPQIENRKKDKKSAQNLHGKK